MGMSWTWSDVIIGVSVFVLTFFGAIAVVAFVVVRLPPDYFAPRVAPPFMADWAWPMRWIGLLARTRWAFWSSQVGSSYRCPGCLGRGFL